MIKLAIAVGFLAVFGFLAWVIIVRIWPREQPKSDLESKISQPKTKQNAKPKS